MAELNNPGENKAWETLAAMRPEEVCRAAAVSYDAKSESYRIRSFGMDFSVSVRENGITSASAGSDVLLRKLGYFFKLSILWYLASSRDIACTGRLVKLQNIRGGDIFTKGSHVLPLEPLAGKYGRDREGFIDKGKSLGGELVDLGDAALRLFPLPARPCRPVALAGRRRVSGPGGPPLRLHLRPADADGHHLVRRHDERARDVVIRQSVRFFFGSSGVIS